MTSPERPAIVVEHRKELSYLLCQAAEIEHLAMCEYLYAAFSLRREPGPGLTPEQLEAVERWRRATLKIAGEEMLHWAHVNNLLAAIGSAPFVSRPPLPHRARGYPPTVQFALLPFGEHALQHFVYFERPLGAEVVDAYGFVPKGPAPAPMSSTELQPRAQDFRTVGELYGALEHGLRHLADKLGEDGLFIGAPWAQATPEAFQWPELVPITDLDTALEVLRRIVEQGEGASGDAAEAGHFGRFRAVLDELQEIKAADPAFEPAHPVTAGDVRRIDGVDPYGPLISDPATAAVSDLFNVVYDLILQMICRYFAFGHETEEQSMVLAGSAVTLMFTVIEPLGSHLATMPVGPDVDGTAGANFQLAYSSSFLLPHRRVAWIRFAERLDEAAVFADEVAASPETRGVLDGVAAAMRRARDQLRAHIEPVPGRR